MEKYLNESGWRLRSKIWQKTINYKTTRLELNLVVRADSNRIGVAEYIKNTLAQQGIIIDIIVASKENYNNYLKNKNYDMILTEITNSISPDLSTYFADRNLANFNNSEAKEIINDVKNITSEDELKNKYQRLYEIYDDQVPYIGIGRNKIYVITNSYLNGDIKSQWYNLFFNIKNWYTN